MGVISGDLGGGEQDFAQADNISGDHNPKGGEVETDVDGVFADAQKNGHPVFDVSPEEFYDNMKLDRKRLRFKRGSKAGEYHRLSKYRNPFFIRNTKDGYLRKVK